VTSTIQIIAADPDGGAGRFEITSPRSTRPRRPFDGILPRSARTHRRTAGSDRPYACGIRRRRPRIFLHTTGRHPAQTAIPGSSAQPRTSKAERSLCRGEYTQPFWPHPSLEGTRRRNVRTLGRIERTLQCTPDSLGGSCSILRIGMRRPPLAERAPTILGYIFRRACRRKNRANPHSPLESAYGTPAWRNFPIGSAKAVVDVQPLRWTLSRRLRIRRRHITSHCRRAATQPRILPLVS
jgi:hypothetical protein